MTPLRRHQLARLTAPGWSQVLARPWDAQARACLTHWAAQGLPLVVTRQPGIEAAHEQFVSLGLPAPTLWGRRRLSLEALLTTLLYIDEFPHAGQVSHMLPRETRPAWRSLMAALSDCGAKARVYGSYGWQHLSGLRYLHPDSDLDLWIAVEGRRHADIVAARLLAFACEHPRLDGELVFSNGAAVNWREWIGWRAGRTHGVLVKYLHGATIEQHAFVPDEASAMEMNA